MCGLEDVEKITLETTFRLNYPQYEILFCVAHYQDPAVQFLNDLIKRFSHVNARLLIGDSSLTLNPKLNNIIKGWSESIHEYVVLVDSNVVMTPDYLQQLINTWDHETGLVCSPPVGSTPVGFWAEVECAFLNTYQARWQLAADSIGFGFAQGKSMLWRRGDLDKIGGISSLGRDIAEDAAATKIVRECGKKVKLVTKPFLQLLGHRSFSQIWYRQLRWARLRRVTFPLYFIPELFSGSLFFLLSAIYLASVLEPFYATIFFLGIFSLWFGLEALYAKVFGWHLSWISPIAWIARDLLIPVLWLFAWTGNNFTWRGNLIDMSDHKKASEPKLTMSFNP
ncbi:MAG: glycosyltransferase [Hyphomicrobium sp.]